jgi:hypothetical protein
VGIDTAAVSFPIDPDFATEGEGLTVQIANPGAGAGEMRKYRANLPGGGFCNWGVYGKAWVEASLPKRAGADNVEPVDVEQAAELLRGMVAEACSLYVTAGVAQTVADTDGKRAGHVYTAENPRLVRLDLVRDFQLREAANLRTLLDGLATVPQAGRSGVRRFFGKVDEGRDPHLNRGAGETLRVGPGAWAAIAYDKCAETGGKAPVGRLRTEFRLHHDQLSNVGAAKAGAVMRSLADVTEVKVERLRRAYFDKVGFGREVVGMGSLVSSVAATAQLSERERLLFLGWMLTRSVGGFAALDVKTERKYRSVAKELGISLAPGAVDCGVTVRLDYERGCEEITVAA